MQVRDLCGTWSYNLNARASEKCQRKDWSVHKQECYNNALWNQKLERPFLQRKEMTVIYCSETAVPFDDLDLQAKYSWPLYPCEENFPVAFVVVCLCYISLVLFDDTRW